MRETEDSCIYSRLNSKAIIGRLIVLWNSDISRPKLEIDYTDGVANRYHRYMVISINGRGWVWFKESIYYDPEDKEEAEERLHNKLLTALVVSAFGNADPKKYEF